MAEKAPPPPASGSRPIRFAIDFGTALIYLKEGHSIKRATWPDRDKIGLKEGILLVIISRVRMHSIAVGDVLAEDWEVY